MKTNTKKHTHIEIHTCEYIQINLDRNSYTVINIVNMFCTQPLMSPKLNSLCNDLNIKIYNNLL